MTPYSDTIRDYLGWCPHTIRTQDSGVAKQEVTGPGIEGDMPKSSPATHIAMPDGFTLLSILILFATLFAGGYIWWPAIVLGITIAGILAFWARTNSRGGE